MRSTTSEPSLHDAVGREREHRPKRAPGDARLTQKLRIATLIDTFELSGSGRQLLALIPRLRERGIETRLILFRRLGEARAPFEEHVEAADIPFNVVTDASRFDPRVVARVGAVLREWNPDIVETHNYRCGAVAFALRILGSQRSWIGFFHGLTAEDRKVRLYHWLDRRVLPRADRIVVMSQTQRALFGACPEKVLQISNAALPRQGVGPLVEPRRLEGLERPRFAVVARLSHEKGVDLFLQALALLKARGRRWSAIVAGDGPERDALTSLAAELGLGADVHFLGHVAEIDALYPHIDVVVLPSRSEGLPNVLLEALQAQRAIVATRVGAVPEVVTDDRAVHLVAPGSAKELADAMARASVGPLAPEAIEAQRRILEPFSLEGRVQAHVELYRAVRSEARPS